MDWTRVKKTQKNPFLDKGNPEGKGEGCLSLGKTDMPHIQKTSTLTAVCSGVTIVCPWTSVEDPGASSDDLVSSSGSLDLRILMD